MTRAEIIAKFPDDGSESRVRRIGATAQRFRLGDPANPYGERNFPSYQHDGEYLISGRAPTAAPVIPLRKPVAAPVATESARDRAVASEKAIAFKKLMQVQAHCIQHGFDVDRGWAYLKRCDWDTKRAIAAIEGERTNNGRMHCNAILGAGDIDPEPSSPEAA